MVSLWNFGCVSVARERHYYLYNNHPAKMRPSLARVILKIYGESPVLDPNVRHRYYTSRSYVAWHAIGIEREEKFASRLTEISDIIES